MNKTNKSQRDCNKVRVIRPDWFKFSRNLSSFVFQWAYIDHSFQPVYKPPITNVVP